MKNSACPLLTSGVTPLIAKALEENPVSPPMRTLWRLVLTNRLERKLPNFDFYDWVQSLKREGFCPTLRLQLRELLTPRVRLSEPFQIGDEYLQDEETGPHRIDKLVSWEVVLGAAHVHSTLKPILKSEMWREVLPELLSDATSMLRDAFDIMRELGYADERQGRSHWQRPSIGEHPQNHDFRDWTFLVDLVRDAWIATAEKYPEQARTEVHRWFSIPYPLFKRLVFFAAANSTLFTQQQALNWLLSDDNWWLWSVETQRETIRLIVAIAPSLGSPDRETLEDAIIQGPPREMFGVDLDQAGFEEISSREVWLRLAKSQAAGGVLSTKVAECQVFLKLDKSAFFCASSLFSRKRDLHFLSTVEIGKRFSPIPTVTTTG